MAVVASATGAAVFGLSGVAAGLAGGALLGAGAGALYSGLTGDGNILDSALTGALLGGAAGGLGAGFGPSSMVSGSAPLTGTGAIAPGAATAAKTNVAALEAAKATAGGSMAGIPVGGAFTPTAGSGASFMLPKAVGTGMTGGQMLATGLAGSTALSLLGSRQGGPGAGQMPDPGNIRPFTYSSKQPTSGGAYPSPYPTGPTYDMAGNPILDTRERNYFDQSYTAGEPYRAASGGLMAAGGPVERMSMMNTAINPQGGMYPQGMIEKTQYALPTQRPTSMEVLQAGDQRMFAEGGITYDAATQRYAGLPSMGGAPTGNSTPLSAELIAQLTPQYQAANPNQFAYDPAQQRYSAATPSMSQLNAFKAFQDQKAAQEAAAAAEAQGYQGYAMGGNIQGYNLGGYSDGGRLLRGPGDGVSDDIPATIGNRQPARLADGEFVIPARIVSELGNGSTDAGAKRLYAMMDRIQSGRKKTIGKNNVAKDTKAKKHLLA
jgi:hypothetical protein